MHPVQTNLCNFAFTAPAGLEGQVGSLPCYRDHASTTSWWRPDPGELLTLAAGGLIQFTQFGQGHPVVSLGASPADTTEPDATVITPAIAAMVVTAINKWHLATVLGEDMPDIGILDGLTLTQLVTAVEMERARPQEPGRIRPLPDDRLVAACYTFLHYRLRPQDTGHEIVIHDFKQALYITWGKGQGPNHDSDAGN